MDKPTEDALAIIGPHKPKANTTDQPLPLDEQTIDAEAKTITIDLTAFESRIGSPHTETVDHDRDTEHRSAPEQIALRGEFSPLAASIALATLLGILAGSGASLVMSDARRRRRLPLRSRTKHSRRRTRWVGVRAISPR